jgi:hypothetical protein
VSPHKLYTTKFNKTAEDNEEKTTQKRKQHKTDLSACCLRHTKYYSRISTACDHCSDVYHKYINLSTFNFGCPFEIVDLGILNSYSF